MEQLFSYKTNDTVYNYEFDVKPEIDDIGLKIVEAAETGRNATHQQDEKDEEFSTLEQMFSLNEFTFSVEVASKCNNVSAEDGPKRTRSGRLIKSTSKFQIEPGNQTATRAALIDSDHENGSDKTGSGSEKSESESESGTETETVSDEPSSNPRTRTQPKIGSQSKYLGDHGNGSYDKNVESDLLNLKCDLCDKGYSSKRSLRTHKKSAHCKKEARPVFTCGLCGKTFSSKSRFEEHKKSHEETYVKESLFCSTCHKIFKTKLNLKYHQLQVHSADSRFKCTVPNCTYGALRPSRLELHMAAVHSDVRLFLCDECPHASKSAGNLKQHKKHVHPVSKDHICCICGKAFAVRSLLSAHEKTHGTSNEGDDSPGKCDSCGAIFSSVIALKIHKKIHDREMDTSKDKDNETSDMKFLCRHCSKNFASLSTMRLHAGRVHFDKFRFTCDQCSFGTSTSSALKNHKLANHTTGRPFKCPTCDKCFRTPRDLDKHVNGVHPVSKDHVCSECGKAFAYKSVLILHQFRKHKIPKPVSAATSSQPTPNPPLQADRPDQDSSLDNNGSGTEQGIDEAGLEHENSDVATKQVRCSVCRKYFVNQENLEKHKLKMHVRRKVVGAEVDEPESVQFPCEECPSTFSAKRNLVIHMKVHNEDYAKNHLTCSICERVFSSEQGLGRHSHKDVPT